MAERREQVSKAFSLKPWLKLIPVTRKAWPAFFLSVVSNILLAGIDFYLPLLQSRQMESLEKAYPLPVRLEFIGWSSSFLCHGKPHSVV